MVAERSTHNGLHPHEGPTCLPGQLHSMLSWVGVVRSGVQLVLGHRPGYRGTWTLIQPREPARCSWQCSGPPPPPPFPVPGADLRLWMQGHLSVNMVGDPPSNQHEALLLMKVSVGSSCSQSNTINIKSFLIDFFTLLLRFSVL